MADPSGRTEYLEATLGLVKCLEITKELIRECVTVPGSCCCMPLLHNHLMDSCSYVRKVMLASLDMSDRTSRCRYGDCVDRHMILERYRLPNDAI